MARPIRETPILFGEDAKVFEERRREVENLPREVREANRAKLLEDYKKATETIIVCL